MDYVLIILQMVVKKDSAVIGYTTELVVPLNTDHRMICKYPDPLDLNYVLVKEAVKWLVINAAQKMNSLKQQHDTVIAFLDDMNLSDLEHGDPLLNWTPGSCEWVLFHKIFLQWTTVEKRWTGVLWVYGKTGSGKSVLSAFITRDLSRLSRQVLCYSHITALQRTPVSLVQILKQFAYQLSKQLPPFREKMAQFAQQIVNLEDCSWHTFWAIIVMCLVSIEFDHPIYWIIDGIYRCPLWKEFILALDELAAVKIPLRFLIVSEQNLEWVTTRSMKSIDFHSLDLVSEDGMQDDLRFIITKKIESWHGVGDLQQELIDRIITSSNGNILCATLLYEQLKSCYEKNQLLKEVMPFPREIMTIYQSIDMKLRAKMAESDHKNIIDITPWVLHVFRPLTKQQIQEGIQYLGIKPFDITDTIARFCEGFFTVDEDFGVRVASQSAADYMLTEQSALFTNPAVSHHAILMSCLGALNATNETWTLPTYDPGSFRSYAARYWYLHLESVHVDHKPAVLDLLVSLFKGQGILAFIFMVSSRKEMRCLSAAAAAINRFAVQKKLSGASSEHTNASFLEKCSIDMNMIAQRFSSFLLEYPQAIFEQVPLFCPSHSFVQSIVQRSIVSIENFFHDDWHDLDTTFPIRHGARGSKIVAREGIFAISTSTEEGLVLIYRDDPIVPFREIVHQERVMAICFNHSKTILATYALMTTKLWNIASGQIINTFPNEPFTNSLALGFTIDEKKILSFCDDNVLRQGLVGSLSQSFESHYLALNNDYAGWRNPSCASFNSQCDLLAIAFGGDPVEIWDVSSSQRIEQLYGDSSAQTDLKQIHWSPRSNGIIGLQKGGSLTLWNLSNPETSHTVPEDVSTMSCSHTEGVLITGNQMGMVKMRRIRDLAVIKENKYPNQITALSITPKSGKIYSIRDNKYTVWEPVMLETTPVSRNGPAEISSSLLPGPQISRPGSDATILVTAISACMLSSTYCAGYNDGTVAIFLHGREKIGIDKDGQLRIEQLHWSPDENFISISDLSNRIYIIKFDPKTRQCHTMVSHRSESRVEQILFNQNSTAVLAVTESHITMWTLETCVMTTCRHSLGAYSRWSNHPIREDFMIGFGAENVEVRQWENMRLIRRPISLAGSVSLLLFGLKVFDYVQQEPYSAMAHPALATCKITNILTCPHLSLMLLVTIRETKECIDMPQYLLVSMEDMEKAMTDPTFAIPPTPLVRSLSDRIALPLGLIPGDGDQDEGRHGFRLVFLNKANWICSTWVDQSCVEQPVQRHFFVPTDLLTSDLANVVKFRSDQSILIPKSGDVLIIHNTLRVCC